MSQEPRDERLSGTILGTIGNLASAIGGVASASGLLALFALGLGLTFLATIPEFKTLGYTLIGIGLGLLLTALIASRRVLAVAVTGRRGRYGANTLVMIAAFVAILGILNFVAFENKGKARLDLTSTRQFSLAKRTNDLLKNLKEPVKAIAFFDKTDTAQQPAFNVVDDMLHEFDIRSDRFSYKVVDPALEPVTAQQYGITRYGAVVFIGEESGKFQQAIGMYQTQSGFVPNPALEQDLVTPLLVVTGEEKKTVYFLTGHGERDVLGQDNPGFARALGGLEADNYAVLPLDLTKQDIAKEKPTVVVVAGPKRDLVEGEAPALTSYLKGGGRMVFLLEPDTPEGFRKLLGRWGVTLGSGLIADRTNFLREQRTVRLDQQQYNIEQASELVGVLGVTYYPGVTSLSPATDKIPTLTLGNNQVPLMELSPLAITTRDSWLVNDPLRTEPDEKVDPRGPFVVAILVNAVAPLGEAAPTSPEGLKVARFVVFGDSDFASNEHFDKVSNGDFFLNSVNYLAGDVSLISIRPKPYITRQLLTTHQEFDFIRYSSWFLLPATMALLGGFVWWRRR